MHNVYMDRSEFLLKFHPKKLRRKGMIPLNHPDLFITNRIDTHHYPENFQQEVPNQISFKSGLLMTNPAHDGLWLFQNDRNESTSFLGGYITPEDWRYSHLNPNYVIFSALVREMIDAHPICRDSVGLHPILQISAKPTLAEFMDLIRYLLVQFKFDVKYPADLKPRLYYQYWITPRGRKDMEYLDSMRIYTLVEVPYPLDKVAPLSNHTHREFIWYSRRDHKFNLEARANRKDLFQAEYSNDLRITESGLDILDDIFHNEAIFGKLDIY